MEITLKVQNIGAVYNPEAKKSIVITHEFNVPSDQLLKKRGRLFITLKIGAAAQFDLKEISSLFLENVQENFYRLTEETPLHALEKALNRAIKLVLGLKSKDEKTSLGSAEANFSLNFATALIWNKVLYTSYAGAPAVYLVRGTGVRNLSLTPATSEIWTNSGILDNQDVIIIGTEAFARTFPANEIINSLGNISQTINLHPHKDELAAMLIKVSLNEDQNGKVNDKLTGEKIRSALSSTLWKVKGKFTDSDKLSDRFKFYQSKKTAPVSSITGLATVASSTVVNLPKSPKKISSPRSKKNKKRIVLGLAMVAATLFGSYQAFGNPPENLDTGEISANISVKDQAQVMGVTSMQKASSPNTSLTTELHKEVYNTESLKNSAIVGISSTTKKIILLDAGEKSLYTVDPDTKETRVVFNEFLTPQALTCDSQYCFIVESGRFFLIDPETPNKADRYPLDISGVTDIYRHADTLYLLTNNKIYSYQIGNSTTNTAKEWLNADTSLEGAVSMAIDGNIYVLTNNNIIKLINGRPVQNFSIDSSVLSSPSKIEVYNGKLYILDGTKLHIFNKVTGAYIETVELTNDIVHPRFIALSRYSSSVNKLLFEKGKILYEVEL